MRLRTLSLVVLAMCGLSFLGLRAWRAVTLPKPDQVFIGQALSWEMLKSRLSLTATDPTDPAQVHPTAIVYLRSIEERAGVFYATVDPVEITTSTHAVRNLPHQTKTYQLESGAEPFVLLHVGGQLQWKQVRLPFITQLLEGERVIDNSYPTYRSIRLWNPDPDTNDSGLSLFYLFADGSNVKALAQRP